MKDTQDTIPQSSGSPDWLLVTAWVCFAVALTPLAWIYYRINNESALLKVAEQFPYFAWSAFGIATIAGILFGIHKIKSSNNE